MEFERKFKKYTDKDSQLTSPLTAPRTYRRSGGHRRYEPIPFKPIKIGGSD